MSSNGHDLEPETSPAAAAATVYLVPVSGGEMADLQAIAQLIGALQPVALAFSRDISAYQHTASAIAERWLAETGRTRSAT